MPWFGGAASRFVRGAAFLLALLLLVPTSGCAEDDAPSLRPLVLGETGWATDRLTTGEQGKLMQGIADETNQARYGDDPHEAEKHRGLFRADRTPKAVFADDGSR